MQHRECIRTIKSLLDRCYSSTIINKGWSFSKLARESGLSVSTIYRYRWGRASYPRFETVARLAAASGISVEFNYPTLPFRKAR